MNARSTTLCAVVLLAALLNGCHSGKDSGDASQDGSKSSASDKGGNSASNSGSSGKDSDSGSGESRSAGLPVGTVAIPLDSQGKAGIRVLPVAVHPFPQQLFVNGQVAMDERHTAHIGARADGVIERVLVLPGDDVKAGQVLAWLHSHSVHETAGALAQAFAAVDRQASAVRFAEINRDRYQRLLSLQVASQEEAQRAGQELKQAQQNLADANASVHMEREHLSELLQVPPGSLNSTNLYHRELVPIRAEGPGTVVQRDVTPGQVLTTGQQAFVVSDLHTVWVMAAVNEKDVPMVHRGQAATVKVEGLGSDLLHGFVDRLGDQVDPQTRTLPVRIVVANPQTRLRTSMFTSAAVQLGSTANGIFIPESAVQDVNGLQAVFVATDATHFAVRAVTLGEHADGMVHVLQGLAPQDHIVVDGAFMVKGELLKGSVGEG